MSKRIVVGLDPSEHTKSATKMACERARLYDGTVIGVAVIDEPGIEKASIGGGVGSGHLVKQTGQHHREQAQQTSDQLLAAFVAACQDAKIKYETVQETGSPEEVLVRESFSADLVMIGTRTFFHYETQEQPGDTLKQVLRAQACPVLAVPENPVSPARVIFPYDGTPNAARAMRMFHYYTSGMPLGDAVDLIHVGDDEVRSHELLDPAKKFLAAHGRNVRTTVDTGAADEQVLAFVRANMPALVVLGASKKNFFANLVFGGVTKELLEDGSVPLFIFC